VDPPFANSKLRTFLKVSINHAQTHNGRRNTTNKKTQKQYKQEPDGNDLSERERNPFLDTDIRKSLDDKLQFITGSLPKFEHQHALVFSQLLSDIERIEDSREKNQTFQYLRVALKNVFPFLKESTELLTAEKSQLKLSVSNHFLFGAPPATWIPFFEQASSGPFSR